jgi:hypothetical protein
LNFLRALLLRCNAKCSQIKSPPFRVAVSILLCNRVLCTCWCTGPMRRDSMEHEKAQPKEAPKRGLWGTLFVVRHSVSVLSSTLLMVFILYLVHIFAQSLSLSPTALRPSSQSRRITRPWRPLRPPDERDVTQGGQLGLLQDVISQPQTPPVDNIHSIHGSP